MSSVPSCTAGWVSAQIILSVIAWYFLGGPSLANFVEAWFIAMIPMAVLFQLWERRRCVSRQGVKVLKRVLLVKMSALWLVAFLMLLLYSVFVAVSSYIFNLALYSFSVGYVIIARVLWVRARDYARQQQRPKGKLVRLLLFLIVLLLIILIILIAQAWYAHPPINSITS